MYLASVSSRLAGGLRGKIFWIREVDRSPLQQHCLFPGRQLLLLCLAFCELGPSNPSLMQAKTERHVAQMPRLVLKTLPGFFIQSSPSLLSINHTVLCYLPTLSSLGAANHALLICATFIYRLHAWITFIFNF